MTRAEALKLYDAAERGAGTEGARKRWRLACHALAQLTDDRAAQAAYALACETHKRADWRIAARELAVALGAAEKRPVAPPKPERMPATLCEFLAASGGLADRGGDLAAMGADRWHRAKAFRPRLVRPDGMCTDVACDMAWERGYFDDAPVPAWDGPDNMHPVTPTMLLDAIERELAGRPRYPNGNDAPYIVPEWDDAEWEAAYPEDAPVYAEAA
jgi:hypothetical protein